MALTRVSRHIIDEPLELQNINATGIGTFASLRVTGDLQVDGTTTTLDTVVTEVDRLEVLANNTTVAAAITQTGSGDGLLVLGGNVGIGTGVPTAESGFTKVLHVYDDSPQVLLERETGSGNVKAGLNAWSGNASLETFTATPLRLRTNGNTNQLYLNTNGNIGIATNSPASPLHIGQSTDNSVTAGITLKNNPSIGAQRFTLYNEEDVGTHYNSNDGGTGRAHIFESGGTERLRITSDGNIGIGTDNAVAKVDVVTGTGDGTQNEANCLRLRNRGNNGNAMTLQVGVNTAAAGALNQGYAYLQGRFWGGGNNPILLNPKGGNVGIGRTSAHVALDVNGDTILRTAGHTTQGDLTRKYGFTGSNASSNPHSYIAGVADQQYWYQGLGLVFGTVRGNDIGGTLGIERMRITSAGDVGIGTANPRYPLEVNSGNLLVSGSAAGNIILEDRGVGDSSRPFALLASNDGNFTITSANRNASGTTTSSVERLRITGFGTCRLPDNGKLTLGDGNDLQIYHESTFNNSVIKESGSGNLLFGGKNIDFRDAGLGDSYAIFRDDSTNTSVELYYNDSKKFETTTTGAKVTGALEVTQEYPSIRPTLDLNFAATKTLDRRITFTRDSVGTYVGENGLVKYASNNVPRFDHDPTTHESLGLLVEESRTNYIDNSNDVSQWNRIINNATVESNTTDTLSPDGTNTSTKITGGTNSGISRDSVLSVSTSTTYTASIFAKKGTADSFKLEFGTGANQFQAVFNLTTKAFSNTSTGGWFASVSTSYVDYPNGWVRVILTGTTSGSASGSPNFAVYGISSGYVYFWGGQAEVGSFVTSLIPTHGSTVTRAADLTKITGTNFTDFYNQTEGSTVFEAKTFKGDSGNVYYGEIGRGSSNRNIMYRNTSSGNAILYYISGGSTVVNGLSSGAPSQVNTNVVTAYAYKENDFGVFASGGYSSTDTSGNVTDNATSFSIGMNNIYSGEHLNGTIKRLSYYNKRLPNAQLQGLTQQ